MIKYMYLFIIQVEVKLNNLKLIKNVLNHKEFYGDVNIDDEFKDEMNGKIITPNIEFEELLYMKEVALSLLVRQQKNN